MQTDTFTQSVYTVVQSIPSGKTMTYKAVAIAAGRPKAYRAVGNILNKNYNPQIPCHRVVRSDSTAGGYNRGSARKAQLLAAEKKSEFLEKHKQFSAFSQLTILCYL